MVELFTIIILLSAIVVVILSKEVADNTIALLLEVIGIASFSFVLVKSFLGIIPIAALGLLILYIVMSESDKGGEIVWK